MIPNIACIAPDTNRAVGGSQKDTDPQAYLGWGRRRFALGFWVASRSVFLTGHQLIFAAEQPHPGRKSRNCFLTRLLLGKGTGTEGQDSFCIHDEQVGEDQSAGGWDSEERSLKPSCLQPSCYFGPCEPPGFCSHMTLVFHTLQMRFRQTL